MQLLERRYSKNPDFVGRRIADEYILVPIREKVGDLRSIFTLNDTAARVWELIDGQRTVGQIKTTLLEEYATTGTEVEADLGTILTQFETIKSVHAN
ncbi:MAG: PqqD family protein [Elusimicrobia bacterium]|nr:PqqD family protein [Elusimicrobiota bacterium]